MASPLNLRNPDRPINVGIFLMANNVELIDVAQVSLLNIQNRQSMSDVASTGLIPESLLNEAVDLNYFWVSEDGGKRQVTTLDIEKTTSFKDCPPLDIIVIGAVPPTYRCTPGELEFLRKSYGTCSAFICICGGIGPALEAGLLQGKTCTAPRVMLDQVRKTATGVNWVERRWCHDGKVWTTGTGLNGLDAMRQFMLETWGNGDRPSLVKTMLQFSGIPLRENNYNGEDEAWKLV